jgi:hypothetical protein
VLVQHDPLGGAEARVVRVARGVGGDGAPVVAVWQTMSAGSDDQPSADIVSASMAN